MKWYHWALIAVGIVVVVVIAITTKSGNPDSLEKARRAKEDKRILKNQPEVNNASELREEVVMQNNKSPDETQTA
jgi:hypothetical protein